MSSPISRIDHTANKKLVALKVLIVDDQTEIRSMIRDILTDAGVTTILEAPNGRRGMQIIAADFALINFIICDWNMPGMTGIQFLGQIRMMYPSLPFLMLTGRCDNNSVMLAKKGGVTGYIRKPFSPGQLEEKLRILVQ
jgi:CheY-like chemotaxis protein